MFDSLDNGITIMNNEIKIYGATRLDIHCIHTSQYVSSKEIKYRLITKNVIGHFKIMIERMASRPMSFTRLSSSESKLPNKNIRLEGGKSKPS